MLCGRCGRRMTVRYTRNGTTPSYECNQSTSNKAGAPVSSIRGDAVDAAVARASWRPSSRPSWSVAGHAGQIEAQARQVERQWQLRLERARYEADLARRRFLAVDPENRLVARNLETGLEREAGRRRTTGAGRTLPAQARPRVWSAPRSGSASWTWPRICRASGTPRRRPSRAQATAALLDQGRDADQAGDHHVAIRWQTEACTSSRSRPPRSADAPDRPGRWSTGSASWPRATPTARSPRA